MEEPIPVLRLDEQIEREQIARLRAIREKRDARAVASALEQIAEAARGTENLVPRILSAVESYATVGEISHALRSVWGEYRESVTV